MKGKIIIFLLTALLMISTFMNLSAPRAAAGVDGGDDANPPPEDTEAVEHEPDTGALQQAGKLPEPDGELAALTETAHITAWLSALSAEPAEAAKIDAGITVNVLNDGVVVPMTLSDYLVGVVAAEMPASFALEALKAQAVASRSCTLYHALVSRSPAHPQADVCTSSACCQAWAGQERLREKWGEDYDMYYDIIRAAVSETDGLCLAYEGGLIYAPYHSSSSGLTEDAAAVWSQTPYLVSVASPETPETVPNLVAAVSVSEADFIAAVAAAEPEADFSGGVVISSIEYTPSGRVAAIAAGGVTLTGSRLRTMFSLRSTDMDISHADGAVTFTTYGYGHGVGMSQYGADLLADNGASFEEILSNYYPGAELMSADTLQD